jgi:hypothetical protein
MLTLKDFQIGPAAGPDDLTVTLTMTGSLPTPPMSLTATVVVQNDGHAAGELHIVALQQVAKAIQETLQETSDALSGAG